MTTQENRLAEIRSAIEAENVSYGEIAELQDIAATHPQLFADDALLAQAAGIPEEQWRQGLKPVEITPGPWSVTESFCNNACNRLVVKRKTWGGEVVADLGEAPDANRANARLIAAAPELLAALRVIAEDGKRNGWIPSFHWGEARAAIAKAEGEQ